MLKRILLVLLMSSPVFGEGLTVARPGEVGMSATRLDRLDSVVNQAIADGAVPGAVVLVARQGHVVYRKAFGERALQPVRRPMTVDTVFDMASMTKVLATATSVMVLVEEGVLSLTDPVSKYIPEFGCNGKEKITVLQLLTHFSGLRPDLDLDDPWTGCEAGLQRAYSERPVVCPGEEFLYSDINYVVLAELVRRTAKESLDVFSEKRIFQPLGMKSTTFHPAGDLLARVAPTEQRDGRMLKGEVHDPTASRMGVCAGHAGLFSTADDTAIYAQMLLNGGTYGGTRILSPLGVLKMTTPQSPIGSEDWRGIGFDVRTGFSTNRGDLFPVGSFGHTGFTGTSLWVDPFSQTIVILFTSRLHPDGKGDAVSLRKKVASVVAASIVDLPIVRERYFPY